MIARAAFAALLLAACAQSSATHGDGAATRVLFIGNSLTAANGLPAMVDAVASASGDRMISTAVAFPNVSLEDHWSRGDAIRAIRSGGWSFVVLQQGPSALPESRVMLREFVRRFDEEVRRSGARTALYMVWPSRARSGDFDAVSASYTIAARDVGATVLPAGDVWRAAWRRDASLVLYGADGFHPSPLGSYVAALTIYHGLGRRHARVGGSLTSPAGAFPPVTVAPGTVTLLDTVVNQ